MVITSIPRAQIIGRMSDGSDREVKTYYEVTVTYNNRMYFKICNEIPTEDNIDLTTFEDITPPPTPEEIQAQILLNTEYLAIMAELNNM